MKWLAFYIASVFAVSLTSNAFAASGELAWVAQSSLMKDKHGRLFYPPTYPNASLTRVNANDGSAIWTKPLPDFAYFQSNCSDGDRLFVLSGSTLMAINPENGNTLWSHDHKGAGIPILNCLPRANDVFLGYGESANLIKAINKYSGKTTWEYSADPYSYIFNSDWQNYYVNRLNNGVNTIVALNIWNGEQRWSRELALHHYPFVDPQGRIYTTNNTQIKRLASSNGEDLWTFNVSGEYGYLEYNESGSVYAHESNRISSLDPDTGIIRWSQPLENRADAYSHTVLLTSGDLVIRTVYPLENRSENGYFNRGDGSLRWKNQSATAEGYILEDSEQNIYQRGNRHLIAFNKNDGSHRWTFDLEAEEEQNIFQIYGQGENLYLTYGNPGKYPPMGLIRLDSANGAALWQHFIGTPFSVVNWDEQRVYIASYLGPETQAFLR